MLIRLDVESKLSDQLTMAFLSVRHEDKAGVCVCGCVGVGVHVWVCLHVVCDVVS